VQGFRLLACIYSSVKSLQWYNGYCACHWTEGLRVQTQSRWWIFKGNMTLPCKRAWREIPSIKLAFIYCRCSTVLPTCSDIISLFIAWLELVGNQLLGSELMTHKIMCCNYRATFSYQYLHSFLCQPNFFQDTLSLASIWTELDGPWYTPAVGLCIRFILECR
jgi:hypothetical protein